VNSGRILRLIILSMVVSVGLGAQTSQQVSRGDIYQKWIAEDVAYIITPEERAEFDRLTSDKDRDHFVVEFWLRRDPTPGTPVNEFKEEHYRRIAYSNQHFAEARVGWKTDRGRIYIVNGPPEEIGRVTPSASTGPVHPAEIWRYKDGRQFRFVDSCDCGKYELEIPILDFRSELNRLR